MRMRGGCRKSSVRSWFRGCGGSGRTELVRRLHLFEKQVDPYYLSVTPNYIKVACNLALCPGGRAVMRLFEEQVDPLVFQGSSPCPGVDHLLAIPTHKYLG